MEYRRAVRRLRRLAETCDQTRRVAAAEPFLRAAYVFGELVEGADPVDRLEVVLVVNLPPEEVTWGTQPAGAAWLVDFLELDKGGVSFWWRSYREPVWNHLIREPVRFWSVEEGIDAGVLDALGDRRADLLRRDAPRGGEEEVRARTGEELAAALAHLREVRRSYWDRKWRRRHRGLGRYPEHQLWEAVAGYLDLLDADDDGQHL
ncbi:hypothetical protein MF672_015325 [Actinomadura sp. ATCC 31491]|uniref:DUF7711 domain-containing protein n=1 Tax=Actinomadura luzonensis TaxID=2805427 RepID=A0ABT0FS46_9ACTN|nr:hypothetical protein [Actinomadura luzonensis]MCK2215150.1 hypothetical protein [Actinomadura luzonensis]